MAGSMIFTGTVVTVGAVLALTTVNALSRPQETGVEGTVRTACAVLADRPVPTVSTVDGEPLDGTPWLSESVGSGPCTAAFGVTHVPIRDQFRVSVAGLSTVVGKLGAASVLLAG